MKNIAILGVARAGKTTLARLIKQRYSNYNIIDGDCIRATFEKVMPQAKINHYGGIGMLEDFPRFCGKLFEYQIREHDKYFKYIFESCDIMPSHVRDFFNINNTTIIFLGYPKLSVEETISNYKKYAELDDYMMKKTEEEIINRATMWLEKSKILKEECTKYNMRFVDVSYNRNDIFEKLVEEFGND